MAERITKTDLQKHIQWLNTATGEDYDLDWAYGGVRVVRLNGSCDPQAVWRTVVSVRGSKREIYNILRGMVYVAELINETLDPRYRRPAHLRHTEPRTTN